MHKRMIVGLVVVALVGGAALSGCETVQSNPKTALGAGAGAATGAVVGGLAGHGTGAVVGGLVGALAGGAVGQYLDRKDKNAGQAAADTSYNPSQGDYVSVQSIQAQPTQIQPGGTVNLQSTYTVLTPNANQPVNVQETRQVLFNGQVVANTSGTFPRTNGTYTTNLPITLPPSAAPGTYQVNTLVAMNGKQDEKSTTFIVR
jgi:outer membrane lipoprotein SlyB